MQRKLGTTTLYVTHDQVEAMTLADRLVVLNKGHAEQIGTPMELYDRPASTFVAEFIGSPSMNLIPSRVENGKLQLGVDIQLDCPHVSAQSVIFGIRPEHVDILPLEQADVPFSVKAVEALGAETLVHGALHLGDGNTPTFIVRLSGNHHFAGGEQLGLSLPSKAWHLFDAQTTKRIEV